MNYKEKYLKLKALVELGLVIGMTIFYTGLIVYGIMK